MQNDVLKNEIAPWQEKGRWYHGIFDCATGVFIADKTDDVLNNMTITTSGSLYYLEPQHGNHDIIDIKIIPLSPLIVSAYGVAALGQRRLGPNGNLAYAFFRTGASSGEIEVFAFCTN